jgi:putative PIN family toxin of toxin-antitoxin system
MRVCIDTNVLVRLFGTNSRFTAIAVAVATGGVEVAVSTEILLEYEEVVSRLSGKARWTQIATLLEKLKAWGSVVHTEPHYHWNVIASDSDDNKFVDCAIAAGADFVLTSDGHFEALRNAGYKPQPIDPVEFMAKYLAPESPPVLPVPPMERRRPPQ